MSNEIILAAFKKYQTIILPILAVVIAIALFGLVVVPQGMKIPQTNKEIQKSQSDLQALNTKLSTLQSIDPQKFRDDLATTLQAFPADSDIAGVFTQIFNVLSGSGLALEDFTVTQTPVDNNTALTDFNLKVGSSGSIENINKFIEQTRAIPRVIKVQAFDTGNAGATPGGSNAVILQNRSSTQQSSTQSNNQTLQISITIQTFFQPLAKSQKVETDTPLSLPTQDNQKMISQIRDSINSQPTATQSAAVPGGKVDPFR